MGVLVLLVFWEMESKRLFYLVEVAFVTLPFFLGNVGKRASDLHRYR
jgi:hypothetical protein